jgi:hypothetical protein
MLMKSNMRKNDECRMSNGVSTRSRSIRHSSFVIRAENRRFVACAESPRLLLIDGRTARRAPVSESCSHFNLSAGCISRDRFKSVSQKNDSKNLKRCEIYRGKVPLRQTQKLKHRLETWTHLRQTL